MRTRIDPKSQINTYGSEHGFGWNLGEIVAAQVVWVPAEKVLSKAQDTLKTVMGVLLSVFGAIVLAINYLLRRAVIRPIRHLVRTAEAISLGDLDAEFEHQNKDEIGLLATAFDRMKSSLKISLSFLDRGEDRSI